MATWFLLNKRIDLYNKSPRKIGAGCVMGDYHARFCERFEVKFLLRTRPCARYGLCEKE